MREIDRAQMQLERLKEPALGRLWKAARRKLEGQGLEIAGAVSIGDPSPEERRAMGGLLGRTLSGKRPRIPLTELDARLLAGPLGCGLNAVLERLGPPLRDKRREEAARAERIFAGLSAARESALASAPWWGAWMEGLEADGILARLERTGALGSISLAVATLERLPWDGHIAFLGAEVSGDTKLLTEGPVGGLVLRALAAQQGQPRPEGAGERRALWETAGVFIDDLASQLLVLGLRPLGETPLAAWLRSAAGEGEPLRLTLHQLRRYGLILPGAPVFACENPAILRRAAETLGGACPALVCTEGQPGAAFSAVARAAAEAGAPLYYHGDFDWPGVRMAGAVFARHAGIPWRMGAADYEEAVAALGEAGTISLKGEPVETPWDPDLKALMQRHGRGVFEEAVGGGLVGDLRSHHPHLL